MLSNPRERRIAYLLFYCGLKPGKSCGIAHRSGVPSGKSIGLRHTIMARLLRNADHLRWRLS